MNGEGRALFKEPKTDNGLKRSARGLLRVARDASGELRLHDDQSQEQEGQGELTTRFLDGQLFGYESLSQIRARLAAQR